MAKSLKDTLKLSPKVALKKVDKNIEETERVVAQIHENNILINDEPAKIVAEPFVMLVSEVKLDGTPAPAAVSEITKRVTLDIPLSLHAEIKMNTFRKGITIKEYLLELARKDLNL
jgi:hypothetical protein